ncbi:MAG: IS1 family transposase [Chloroflexota bacterium]
MIQETITYTCDRCDSPNIIRNGKNKCGNQQYHCKDCGTYRVLKPKQSYSDRFREQVLRAARERVSLRGLERIFGLHRQTVLHWIAQQVAALPGLADTLLPVQFGDVLEVDEAWSFVARKADKHWLWTVMCRHTRQIIAFVIGDHSGETCRRLWRQIPDAYRFCRSFSDFWRAYQQGFPDQTHQQVGKETGETAHMERWYNTLRQWLGRYTRRTLAFSRTDYYHELVTRWFIIEHNLRMRSSLTM